MDEINSKLTLNWIVWRLQQFKVESLNLNLRFNLIFIAMNEKAPRKSNFNNPT